MDLLVAAFVWPALFVTLAFGAVGFADDWLKIRRKSPKGLSARHKYFWLSLAGFATSLAVWMTAKTPVETTLILPMSAGGSLPLGWLFIPWAYLVIVGSSNAVNLTDGLDGLAIMPTVLVASALAVFAYATGNVKIAGYLEIPYIAGVGELAIFCTAIAGAGLGFLWFNAYPAQVFMGDVGALALGAALGVVAVLVRQEIVLDIMGGVPVAGDRVGGLAGAVLQVQRRQAHLPHGAAAPSLRAEGLAGAQDHRALLDRDLDPGAGRPVHPEGALAMAGTWTGKRVLVVGLGKSGAATARYLAREGAALVLTDSRAEPPDLGQTRAAAAGGEFRLGRFDAPQPWSQYACAVVSPGVPLEDSFVAALRAAGVEILGDIELFARAAAAPVIGITGCNGKSTVTSLVGAMAWAAGLHAGVGGNLGTPALDLLAIRRPGALRCWNCPASSSTPPSLLKLAGATILNISPDHLDRHGTLERYIAAKARIYAHAQTAVVNRDDRATHTGTHLARRVISFGLDAPGEGHYGLLEHEGQTWLARGASCLSPLASLKIQGLHNAANALAALALAEAAGLPREASLRALAEFKGLPHRCEWVAESGGVTWSNDSKGTNVGATLAALHGLPGPLVWLGGGQGKNQDFSPLRAPLRDKGRAALLFGADAARLESDLNGALPVRRVADLGAAVSAARGLAKPGDRVPLSPACASLDQFKNYEDRGAQFAALVRGLA